MSGTRVLLGEFGRAQGVRGEVRIKSYTQDPMRLPDYAPLTSEDGRRMFAIVSARPLQGDMIVARVAGVDSREAAEALTRQPIYAPRAALEAAHPLEDGEFMQADLVGLAVRDTTGAVLGRIVGVENYGAGDLLAIALDGRTFAPLLPFTDAFVPAVDVAGGHVVIDPPIGWDEE
jgi:16S rRNA processing protein RimM